MFNKIPDNQYDVRSSRDLVSALGKVQQNKNLHTIPAESINPLTEHKTEILDRQPDRIYGKISDDVRVGGGLQSSNINIHFDPTAQQLLTEHLNHLRDSGQKYPKLYSDLMIDRRVNSGKSRGNDLIRYNELYREFNSKIISGQGMSQSRRVSPDNNPPAPQPQPPIINRSSSSSSSRSSRSVSTPSLSSIPSISSVYFELPWNDSEHS